LQEGIGQVGEGRHGRAPPERLFARAFSVALRSGGPSHGPRRPLPEADRGR
jgi:hypothetical protein